MSARSWFGVLVWVGTLLAGCGNDGDGRADGPGGMAGGGGQGALPEGACGWTEAECETFIREVEDAIEQAPQPECSFIVYCEPGGACVFLAADSDEDGFRADCSRVPSTAVWEIKSWLAGDEHRGKRDCDDRDVRVNPGAEDAPPRGMSASVGCEFFLDNSCDHRIQCPCKPAKDAPTISCYATAAGATIEALENFFRAGIEHPPGTCEYGTRTCIEKNVWGECNEAVGPKKEDCASSKLDQDCDGRSAAEEVADETEGKDVQNRIGFYCDADGDRLLEKDADVVYACEEPSYLCEEGSALSNWIANPQAEKFSDCDDKDRSSFTDGIEECDGRDNDCDGEIDEDIQPRGHDTVEKYECRGGHWELTCKNGRLDCNSNDGSAGVDDGCEFEAKSIDHCGACDVSCTFSCGESGNGFACGEVVDAAIGAVNACAVLSDGRASCWGRGAEGELGSLNPQDLSSVPVEVANLTGVRAIALGASYTATDSSHGCAIAGTERQVYCWGEGLHGQNGNIRLKALNQPAQVELLYGGIFKGPIAALALGKQHSMALTDDGWVFSWGDGARGQLGGAGVEEPRAKGTRVYFYDAYEDPLDEYGYYDDDGNYAYPYEIEDAKQISAYGDHSCVLLSTGQVACAGDNEYGQLGNQIGEQETAVYHVGYFDLIRGLTGVTKVETGYAHTCALLESGQVMCWGKNDIGQLGRGEVSSPTNTPLVVLNEQGDGPLEGAESLIVGHSFSCALIDGEAFCWGAAAIGQLGHANSVIPDFETLPKRNPNLTDIRVLRVREGTGCALTGDSDALQCWGGNTYGELGRGEGRDFQPHPVPEPTKRLGE